MQSKRTNYCGGVCGCTRYPAFYPRCGQCISKLDKSCITTGILYDRIYPFAVLNIFNTSEADTSSANHFLQAYYEMFNTAYNNAGFTLPDTIDAQVARILATQVVPIGILNYKFNQMDTNAVADNLISESNGLFYDVAGRPRSPYWLKQVSVISPLTDSVFGLQVTFKTTPALYLQNTGRTITSLQADFNNGAGLVSLGGNNTLTVNYTTYGEKIIKFVITYNDNTQRTTFGKINVVQGIMGTSPGTTCDQDAWITATTPFTDYEGNTFKGQGNIRYYFATNVPCINTVRKPIIVLDGYDPTDDRKIPDLYSIYLNNESRYKFADELRSQGYDIVVLNFPDYVNELGNEVHGGADYIERNAFVLVELINTLKNQLAANSSAEQIVIVGPSMGGLISRYALAYMEKNSIPHNTRLWISFDAPHNGANISIGVQKFLEFFADNGNKKAKKSLDTQLNNPAARQLLLDYYSAHTGSTPAPSPFRTTFTNALKNNGLPDANGVLNGFPKNLRKIAIANGSLNGALQPNTAACQKALDMQTYLVRNSFLFKQRWFRGAQASIYFSGSYGNSCSVFTGSQLLHGTTTVYGSAPSNTVSYDIAPGGYYNTFEYLANEAKGFSWGGILMQIFLPLSGTNTKFNLYNKTHAFIPTKSALAFTGANQDLAESLYERNLICTQETPFDTYYGGLVNLDHVYITPEIAHFAIDEIIGTQRQPAYLSTIPGLYVTGPNTFCAPGGTYNLAGGTLPSGTSIVWNPGSIASIASGQGTTQVQLSRISNGTATLTASLSKTCSINQTVSKTYSIGGYGSSDYPVSGPSSASCGQYLYFSTNDLPSATNYQWFWPSD